MKAYLKFCIMIMASTVLMFILMYLNTYSVDHLYFSETRSFMAIVMGAAMALVMLGGMWGMYPKKKLNLAIMGVSLAAFCVALWLLRSQRTVDDAAYMKGMIPHHSIAILTSDRAKIRDPRVRALADRIIETQRREIEEMKMLVREMEGAK